MHNIIDFGGTHCPWSNGTLIPGSQHPEYGGGGKYWGPILTPGLEDLIGERRGLQQQACGTVTDRNVMDGDSSCSGGSDMGEIGSRDRER